MYVAKIHYFLWISRAHKIHENLNPTKITNHTVSMETNVHFYHHSGTKVVIYLFSLFTCVLCLLHVSNMWMYLLACTCVYQTMVESKKVNISCL